ncbi:hypothetical protein Tco_0593081 [Tanacetum coccineum]
MKEILRNCHGHDLSKGNIIKIFYHGLNKITQEVINVAVGGIFLYKTPNQAYQLLEDKVLLKLDVNPFGGGNPGFHDDHYDNPLLTKETESEPIIWDIGDEEEEYPFVNKYPSFQEEPIVLVEEKSCPVYDTDNKEEESMPIYDTDIEDVIEEEEGFFRKGGFGGEEDNIEYIVVVANDICSSMIQTTLSVYVEEDVNTKLHELMSFGKSIIIKVSQSLFKFLIRKKYQEWYLKAAPMVDKLGLKMIKVRGRVIIKKGNLMQGIQVWMLRVQGTSEANSRTSFSQAREDDAEALTFSQSQNA